MTAKRRICLVGAGAVAAAHAEVIRGAPGLTLSGAADPNTEAAKKFAARWGAPSVYASVEAALAQGEFDAAHILTPPDRRMDAALPFLEAGIDTFCEKPMAASAHEADILVAAAAKSGAALGVNQNFVHAPAFVKMRKRLAIGEIGPLRHLSCIYRAPLRQLEARRFGAWMFRKPLHMLLEQAIHPLSQLHALAGAFDGVVSASAKVETVGENSNALLGLSALFEAEKATAALNFAVGESYPVWRLEAIGADGAVIADILENRCYAYGRTQWLEAIDRPLSAIHTTAGLMGGTISDTARYALSQIRLAPRADPFFRSMRASILAFHEAAASGDAFETDGAFGAEMVRNCERLAKTLPQAAAPARAMSKPKLKSAPAVVDVSLIGGAGFIGSHTLSALIDAGYAVSVMARHVENLPAIYFHEKVALIEGDARRRSDVDRALSGARFAINLAHGGGGESYEETADAMRAAAETIAEASLERNVERFIHIGSIASLYLGRSAVSVSDPAEPDPQAEKRAPYARAKAETDRLLTALRDTRGLPLILLRPGLVVGAGGSPLHSGLGFFNNSQHCVGWNRGRNPLPFVLAGDVGQAIVSALTAPDAIGRSYLLAGDVRPSARDYIARLAEATGRPLRYHPAGPTRLWLADMAKWGIKRIGGRRAALPYRRDYLSRGLQAALDCAAAKADLDWAPENDPERFYAAAFADVNDGRRGTGR